MFVWVGPWLLIVLSVHLVTDRNLSITKKAPIIHDSGLIFPSYYTNYRPLITRLSQKGFKQTIQQK